MKNWLPQLIACRSQLHVFLEGMCSSNTNYALDQTPVTQFSWVILLKCMVSWWKSAAATFCWLLRSVSGLSSSPFPSVIALAQSWSRWMGESFFRGSCDGYVLPEGCLLRLEKSLASHPGPRELDQDLVGKKVWKKGKKILQRWGKTYFSKLKSENEWH